MSDETKDQVFSAFLAEERERRHVDAWTPEQHRQIDDHYDAVQRRYEGAK